MGKVFLVDTNKQPLDPVHPGWARKLLNTGQAAVLRRYPFTLILKKQVAEEVARPLRLKLDPGSKTTGFALVDDPSGEVVFAAELTHRGQQIKNALHARRAVRRWRRQRKTRYRAPQFDNRRRPKGWLAPSLESRIATTLTWTRRLMRVCPITEISMELVKFDMQLMDHPEIAGIEYQQGELAGYEVREYLLEKWGRRCAYCDAKDVPLQIEHLVCRARGGTDRVSNVCLACEPCNRKKGTQDISAFLKRDPVRLARILAQAKAPLRDAAAVNTTRWVLYERLKTFGLPIECGSGGLTKYNRVKLGFPKAHWTDAACVGKSTPQTLCIKGVTPLLITAMGHGSRQMCCMNKWGFPRTGPKAARRVKGFQTGDIVRAVVPTGKYAGRYTGRVAVRRSGSFDVTTANAKVQGISYRFCSALHCCDGYDYRKGGAAFSPAP
ncbi:MAG: HNH endonuclease [Chloroflexi bacterium]|nr:MAG: HNH endonuclease [Chloroflexota bacterium]